MNLLDGVPEDSNPLSITIDFTEFENGAKFSTLFRTYFDRYKDTLGLSDGDYSAYVGQQLLIRLKDVIKGEERALLEASFTASIAALSTDKSLAEITLDKIT